MADLYRGYKDSVFCSLFYRYKKSHEYVLSLYKALTGDSSASEKDIEFVRLENSIFTGLHNDVAFKVGNKKIYLIEHQSTKNNNMPFRCLLYVAREYEKIVPEEVRYKNELVKLPKPEFYVFYNGESDYPLETELKLSDAFTNNEFGNLELKVKIININYSKSHELLTKCKILGEYADLVDTERRFRAEGKTGELAVRDCLNRGILKDFLTDNCKEVWGILDAEYNANLALKVAQDEAKAKGLAEGLAEGREEGRALGFKAGEITASRNIARNLLVECGLSKEVVEMSVGCTLEELNLNDDGTPKEP